MVRGHAVLGFGLAVGAWLFSLDSQAAEEGPPPKDVEFSAGLLGLVGGNYFTTPSNTLGGDGLGFRGDGGGFGWGFAAYGEGRFVRHLGLTLTLGYDRSVVQRDVTINGLVTVNEKITIGSPRLGLMAKGIFLTPFGRLWVGLGPQFVLSTSSDAELSEPIGELRAEEANSTLLDFGGGLVVHAGERIEIPFQIIASKNLSQGDEWSDRVTPTSLSSADVKTQSSWEFRMGIGVGARF
jgi:hypothetical protein